ncbi:MAG: SufD family Fe-S cluster assembly protein [Nanoarchaeota archaeon]|nr:SufD family Fe-S cluster assembly protein [Nanoarchaeota archaeon]
MMITIAKQEHRKEPIFLDSTLSSEVIITAEEGSSAVIVDTVNHPRLHVTVAKNAFVRVWTLYQNPSVLTFHKRGEVKSKGKLEWVDVIITDKELTIDLKTHLQEVGAETKQLQAFVGRNSQKIVITSDVVHEHNQTVSLMKAKGVLHDNAKLEYQGTIKINKDAAGCRADQRTDTLLFGDEARCDAVPILEVENDNVQCSHGASMGQLDQEQLFYVLSRGFDEHTAQQLIINGFLEPIIREISDDSLQQKMTLLLQEKTHGHEN